MNCNDAILDAHYDGELPAAETAAVQAHLASCAACASRLAALRSLSQALAAAGRETPTSEAMWAWKSVHRRRSEQHVRRLAGWLTTAAAAALAISLLTPTESSSSVPASLGEIETAVLARGDESETPGVLTAQWMAADLQLASLSREGGRR